MNTPTKNTKLAHVLRSVPPWRLNPVPIAYCGLINPDYAWDYSTLRTKHDELGAQRLSLFCCMTCLTTVSNRVRARRAEPTFEHDPVEVLHREALDLQRRTTHSTPLPDELRALALLVAAHPEEFAQTMASLSTVTPLRPVRSTPR